MVPAVSRASRGDQVTAAGMFTHVNQLNAGAEPTDDFASIDREWRLELARYRHENATEHLYRLTTLDLKVASGYLSLQLALGAWLSQGRAQVHPPWGLCMLNFALLFAAYSVLLNTYVRRREFVGIAKNCAHVLGFEADGVYLKAASLNNTVRRPGWIPAGVWERRGSLPLAAPLALAMLCAFCGVAWLIFSLASSPGSDAGPG